MRQTNNRAEIYAFLDMIDHTQGDVHYVTDSSVLLAGWQKGRARRGGDAGSNKDLWFAIAGAIEERGEGAITMSKIESHTDFKEDTNLEEWIGNEVADVLAKAGAAFIEPDRNEVQACEWALATLHLIHLRLAVVTQQAIEDDPREDKRMERRKEASQAGQKEEDEVKKRRKRTMAARKQRTALVELNKISPHTLTEEGQDIRSRMVRCLTCGQRCARQEGEDALLAWARTPCSREATEEGLNGLPPWHDSHACVYWQRRRQWMCTRCGGCTSTGWKGRLQLLAEPCQDPRRKGREAIAAWRRGAVGQGPSREKDHSTVDAREKEAVEEEERRQEEEEEKAREGGATQTEAQRKLQGLRDRVQKRAKKEEEAQEERREGGEGGAVQVGGSSSSHHWRGGKTEGTAGIGGEVSSHSVKWVQNPPPPSSPKKKEGRLVATQW